METIIFPIFNNIKKCFLVSQWKRNQARKRVRVNGHLPSSGSRELWVEVLKNGPSKICGKQPLKNLRWYGCLTQILLGPFLNTLIHVLLKPKQADVIITREQKRLENTILSTDLKRFWLYSVGCGSVTYVTFRIIMHQSICVSISFFIFIFICLSLCGNLYIYQSISRYYASVKFVVIIEEVFLIWKNKGKRFVLLASWLFLSERGNFWKS